MRRQHGAEKYELSDAEKRDLIKLIRLPGVISPDGELVLFEDQWTGAYIFENEWQSFRIRKNRDLELLSAPHTYDKPGPIHYRC